jgi:hypothetical protein
MRTILYRRWAPAKSAVKIEFPPDIFHDIRVQSIGDHDRGYLFGRREGNEVRISTAIRTPQAGDPRTAGTQPVGVYIARARGEVFLTDADLEQVDRVQGGIALVIAGGRAGFFSREPDGTMQAVRSHEEFLVATVATQAQSLARPSAIPRPSLPPPNLWKWILGLTGLLGGPVAALAFLQPLLPQPPIELALREINGQLIIQWDPRATPFAPGSFLEITEAEGRTVLPVASGSSSATYSARSGDVEIRLSTVERSGRVHWTSALFAPPVEPAVASAEFNNSEQIQEDMAQLESQAAYLRQAIARRQAKVAQLSAEADKLLGPIQ